MGVKLSATVKHRSSSDVEAFRVVPR